MKLYPDEVRDDKLRYEIKENQMRADMNKPVYLEDGHDCPTCGKGTMDYVPKSQYGRAHLRCFVCGQKGYDIADYKYQNGD